MKMAKNINKNYPDLTLFSKEIEELKFGSLTDLLLTQLILEIRKLREDLTYVSKIDTPG